MGQSCNKLCTQQTQYLKQQSSMKKQEQSIKVKSKNHKIPQKMPTPILIYPYPRSLSEEEESFDLDEENSKQIFTFKNKDIIIQQETYDKIVEVKTPTQNQLKYEFMITSNTPKPQFSRISRTLVQMQNRKLLRSDREERKKQYQERRNKKQSSIENQQQQQKDYFLDELVDKRSLSIGAVSQPSQKLISPIKKTDENFQSVEDIVFRLMSMPKIRSSKKIIQGQTIRTENISPKAKEYSNYRNGDNSFDKLSKQNTKILKLMKINQRKI